MAWRTSIGTTHQSVFTEWPFRPAELEARIPSRNDWGDRLFEAFEAWAWDYWGMSPWEDDGNRGDCPYYEGTGLCGYGCDQEPECVTYEPREGWPKFTNMINGIGGRRDGY